MYSYLAYGLRISSELLLPELLDDDGSADVFVRLDKIARGELQPQLPGILYRATPRECCFVYESITSLIIRDGREIIVEPAPGVEARELNNIVTGPALGVLLQQRGRIVLHASAVALNHHAVGFLGGPRWGKSTTAAAMLGRGHEVVTDDVLAVDIESAANPIVFPGFPQLKLWPEAAVASLGDAPEQLPRIHPQVEKRARRTDDAFVRELLPLRCLYVLSPPTDGQSEAEIEPLRPHQAFIELTRHSYCAPVPGAMDAAADFQRRTRLANRVPIFRLNVRRSLDSLPELAKSLEEHLARV
jgi:hypothetical protein